MKIEVTLIIDTGDHLIDESYPSEILWLFDEVLTRDNLSLHSNEIGDSVGDIISVNSKQLLSPQVKTKEG